MAERLRIVVTGLAATYPFGGVFWDYLQFALGFVRLGHDVLYLEDNGNWCYDPAAQTFVESGSANAALLKSWLARLDAEMGSDLKNRWFFRDSTGALFGSHSWNQTTEFCKSADLFVHISASCWMRDEYWAAKRLAFIDSDPMYTQASVPAFLDGTIDEKSRQRVEMIRRHHVHFTFAENIAAADCRIPRGLFNWIPTRQPMVLDCFAPHALPIMHRRKSFTTVASWEPTEKGPIIGEVQYVGKSREFERFIDLPSRSRLPLEVALSGPAPMDRLRQAGWILRDGYEVSKDPWVYRDYLAHSSGEWSVAKNAYVASRSGWFSCRTTCYLALGVAAVVQSTGFETALPSNGGVLPFDTLEQAAEGIARIIADPIRESTAASDFVRMNFDAADVLIRLLDAAR